MTTRRDFIKHLITGGVSIAIAPRLFSSRALFEDDPWQSVMPGILARIKAPLFPKRDFVITKFGAKGDGLTNCTAAFQKRSQRVAKPGVVVSLFRKEHS
jgi:polygalacturonase